MLDACSRFIGVGRSAFLFFYRHKFHPAFRTISRMISYDFGMHQAGVLLHLLLVLPAACSCSICGRLRSIAPTCAVTFVASATAIAKSRISLFTGNLEIPVARFVLCGAHRAVGATVRHKSFRRGAPKTARESRALPRRRESSRLGAARRSVSEKARLQDQFSERKCAGWSSVE